MYIIIAGCRKIGSSLANMLSLENHDIVVIDSEPGHFDLLGTGFNGLTIAGMPIDEDILRSAGIERADALAAVTNDDNMNVMVSEIAKNLFHVPVVITRINDPAREAVFSGLGLNTICPTTIAVKDLKNLLIPQHGPDAIKICGTDVSFQYSKPSRQCIKKTLSEIKDKAIFGIIKNGRFLIAAPDVCVDAGDTLVVAECAGKVVK